MRKRPTAVHGRRRMDDPGATPYARAVANGTRTWKPEGSPPQGATDGFASDEDFGGPFEVTLKLPVPGQRNSSEGLIALLRVVAGRDLAAFAVVPPGGSVVVGRDEAADLALVDSSVSRHHARVECSSRGEFTIVDLGSTNGTALNGSPVRRSPIVPGDAVEVGSVLLRLDQVQPEELEHLRRVVARLREATGRDPLTGLLSRTWLDEHLPDQVRSARTHGQTTTCVFLDLDHFKAANDRYGHAVGDDVLCACARLLVLDCRESDRCVRYGGEEFLVFLLDTPLTSGLLVAERIRRTLQGHDWSRIAPDLRITGSAGVATLRPGEALDAWIARADAAMYQAKALGRNRVSAAEGD
ncbi:MAG: GGDEF domain-containing protein [Deltaproteobacteria bacterium]|nr:GGDEF domain-containing protein [Deltaproteobacteria bacterium]